MDNDIVYIAPRLNWTFEVIRTKYNYSNLILDEAINTVLYQNGLPRGRGVGQPRGKSSDHETHVGT